MKLDFQQLTVGGTVIHYQPANTSVTFECNPNVALHIKNSTKKDVNASLKAKKPIYGEVYVDHPLIVPAGGDIWVFPTPSFHAGVDNHAEVMFPEGFEGITVAAVRLSN